jgi:hypothetical protein
VTYDVQFDVLSMLGDAEGLKTNMQCDILCLKRSHEISVVTTKILKYNGIRSEVHPFQAEIAVTFIVPISLFTCYHPF